MKIFNRWVLLTSALWACVALSGCSNDGGDKHHADHQKTENAAETHTDEKSHKEGGQHEDERSSGHKDESHDDKRVHVDEQQLNLLDIEVSKAPRGQASDVVSMPATIEFDSDRVAKIGPRLEAKVVKVLVDLGDRVSAGAKLALMDSVELGRAKSDLIGARAKLDAAKAHYQREKELARDNVTSQSELLETRARFRESRATVSAARETLKLYGLPAKQVDRVGKSDSPLSQFTLVANLAGVVQQRDLSPGETVNSSQTPIHIVDTRQMWLMIDAYEQAFNHLQPGQSVSFTSRGLPGERFEGQIDWISRELNVRARTLPARAVMDNTEGRLRAGMSGTVRIQADNGKAETALIPVDAVQRLDNQSVVFVPGRKSGAYRALEVTLGAQSDGYVEVTQGLQPGESVVTQGAFDLMSALTASTRSAAHSH